LNERLASIKRRKQRVVIKRSGSATGVNNSMNLGMKSKKRHSKKPPGQQPFENNTGVVIGISVMGMKKEDINNSNYSSNKHSLLPKTQQLYPGQMQPIIPSISIPLRNNNLGDIHKNAMHIKKLNCINRAAVMNPHAELVHSAGSQKSNGPTFQI